MGLGRDLLHEMAALRRARIFRHRPKVVEIGAQQLSNDFLRAEQELGDVFALFGRSAPPALGSPIDAGRNAGVEAQAQEAPSSRPFWEALGFEYAAIDFDGHRQSRPLDLNKDSVPDDWRGHFDLLINAGTTEHVANQDNAFRVMHDLVRPNGIMIHDLPSVGMLTHGLVTYTMKFFWQICQWNKYQVLRLEMNPGEAGPLPPSIVATSSTFGRQHNAPRFQAELIRDWTIVATLRKVNSRPFVTPLDLPPEAMDILHRRTAQQRPIPWWKRRLWPVTSRRLDNERHRGDHAITGGGLQDGAYTSVTSAPTTSLGSRDETPPEDRVSDIEAESSFILSRDFCAVTSHVGFHPFIFVRLDNECRLPESFMICRTQNDAAQFVRDMAALPRFEASRLLRGISLTLQQHINAAVDSLCDWIEYPAKGPAEAVHIGDQAILAMPAFAGYPAYGYNTRHSTTATDDRRAILANACTAYLDSAGNDALRFALIEALTLALGRTSRAAEQDGTVLAMIDRAIAVTGGSHRLSAARQAMAGIV